jgi:DNA-binding transcriptional regulator YbjK
MPGRRDQVLDAAIRVLGEEGTRALTHRAVDTAGELPAGTTSNHFRTRDALISGVLGHLLELETTSFAALVGETMPTSADELAERIGATLRQLAGPGRTMTLARHAIFLEAAHSEVLRRELLGWSEKLWTWGGEWLAAIGSQEPVLHTRQLLAYADGLLLDRLARGGDEEFAPEASLAALLHALVDGPRA